MKIKLYLDKRQDKSGKRPVRLSVATLGNRYITSLGCSMNDDEFEALSKSFAGQKPLSKARHQRHAELIRMLNKISDKIEWEVEKVKRGELSSGSIDIAGIVNECKGRKKTSQEEKHDAAQLILKFIDVEKKSKDLSKSSIIQFMGLYRDIRRSFPGLTIEDASTKVWLQKYLDMYDRRGYNSNTIRSKYRLIHWFLKWAYQNGFCDDDFTRFKFELKVVSTQERFVVFLTMDEIMAIKNHETDPNSILCKDIFLFQCFTGLRYSDVIKLKNTDINLDMITIMTQKTGVLLHNKLNAMALEIVEKYHNKFGETLFPYVSDGTINIHIREICRQLGMNQIITRYEYRNHEREEITGPKWQFISTHVGRKSFVVNSLDMGLTATQVIGYTGHSSIQAMQPYISISQKKKDAAMDVWDNAIAASDKKDELDDLYGQIEALKKRISELENNNG